MHDAPPAPDDVQLIDAPVDTFVAPAAVCAPLVADPAAVVVSDVTTLRATLATAVPGTTIALADGTYDLSLGTLIISTPGVTLRSQSGDATKVILDGAGSMAIMIRISASNVTITAVTVAHAQFVGVMVEPTSIAVTGTKLHDITFLDDGGPAVRIFPAGGDATIGPYADNGVITCSRFVDTPTGADHCAASPLGIDGRGIRGWTISHNRFVDNACATLHRRTVVVRGGSRATQIINNHFSGSAMNILLGDGAGTARTYGDALPPNCAGVPEHWGGLVCNNVIAGLGVPSIGSNADFEEGIALWTACDTLVIHNTIVSPGAGETFHDIEYRFPGSYVNLVNNLLLEAPASRDSGAQNAAYAASNVTYASEADFVDAAGGDLHLAAGSSQQPGASIANLGCSTDADGKPRSLSSPMPGAYER